MFHNNDVNPKKSIKKKRFLKSEKIEQMKQLIGENCWEEEFDKLDQDRDEKITFEDLLRNCRILHISKNPIITYLFYLVGS